MIADVELGRLETFDTLRIRGFFESLGEGDRTFVRAAVLRPGVIESWIDSAGTARDRRYLAVVTAARDGIRKLVVEVLAHEEATIAMFTGLGFEAEGLLREHVLSTAGQSYDVLVLAHFVDQLYETMATVGMEESVTR